MKKSYNPFLMFGSYLGALGFLFVPYLFFKLTMDGVIYNAPSFSEYLQLIGYGLIFTSASIPKIGTNFLPSIIVYGTLIFGFLLGWGIHSLVRALRR
jgi:hypothetical protein